MRLCQPNTTATPGEVATDSAERFRHTHEPGSHNQAVRSFCRPQRRTRDQRHATVVALAVTRWRLLWQATQFCRRSKLPETSRPGEPLDA